MVFLFVHRHELIAENDLAIMQTAQVLHFLADLIPARSGAAHDESLLVTAAVKLKWREEDKFKNDLFLDFQFSNQC